MSPTWRRGGGQGVYTVCTTEYRARDTEPVFHGLVGTLDLDKDPPIERTGLDRQTRLSRGHASLGSGDALRHGRDGR